MVLASGLDSRSPPRAAIGRFLTAGGRIVLFGFTYVTERGLVELWKGYLREEDQSTHFIPMHCT
jgi:hypothetical protein